jgi:hypothetical protein
VTLVLNIEFAFTECIPEFDGPVPATRDNLSVISTEADAQNVACVTDKSPGSKTSVQIPEAKSVVP